MEKRYNFDKKIFWIIFILILIGIGLCVELSVIFYKTNFHPDTYQKSFCAINELIDCDAVALTKYSLSFGVPNSIWGLLLYCVMLMLLFVDRIQNKFKNTIFDVFKNPKSYIASLAVLSFLISMILAFISIKVINKICTLCFCTYVIDLFIAFAARGKESFISHITTTIKDFIEGAKKYIILFIIVLTTFLGTVWYLNDSVILSPKLKNEKMMKEFYEPKNKYAVKENILGKENSKVEIVVYSDFYCPFCRVLNTMIHKLAKEKNILITEVHFPLDTKCNYAIGGSLPGHEFACLSAKYAIAAKNQNKYWGVANAIFEKQPKTENEIIQVITEAKLGIDIPQLKSDAYSPKVNEELMQDIKKGASHNLLGTPALEIDGIFYMGGFPYETLKEKIDLAIKRAQNN